MDHYLQILAIPNLEIEQSVVCSELMQAIHQMLPTFEGRIGLTFPLYKPKRTLGPVIRAHGSKEDLIDLSLQLHSNRTVTNYSILEEIKPVPKNIVRHVRYHRHQVRNHSRLRRMKKRQEAQGTWSAEKEAHIKHTIAIRIELPFVKLKSASTDQEFFLFINRTQTKKPDEGLFNAYGLSLKTATLPMF